MACDTPHVKRLLSGAVALAAIVLSAAPASAAHLTLDDPAGDASNRGLDLTSAEELVIAPGGRALVDTGMAVALPPGSVGLVCPRSGLAAKHGVTVLNGPGVVDAGYRGPIKVALLNTDPEEPFALRPGDRIAQLVIVPVLTPVLRTVDELDATDRAEGGFGSSGGFGTAAPTTEEA